MTMIISGSGGATFPDTTTQTTAATGPNLQEFTTTGTYTKPASCTFVMVECWGGGGGGGSGRRGATSTNRLPGGGGGGGAYTQRLFKASDLTSTVTVTIAAGGTGAAGQTSDSTDGITGSNGGNTTFGAYLTAFGGGGGGGGTTVNTIRGGGGGGALTAANGPGTPGQPTYIDNNNALYPGAFGGPNAYNYGGGSSGWGGGGGGTASDDGAA